MITDHGIPLPGSDPDRRTAIREKMALVKEERQRQNGPSRVKLHELPQDLKLFVLDNKNYTWDREGFIMHVQYGHLSLVELREEMLIQERRK